MSSLIGVEYVSSIRCVIVGVVGVWCSSSDEHFGMSTSLFSIRQVQRCPKSNHHVGLVFRLVVFRTGRPPQVGFASLSLLMLPAHIRMAVHGVSSQAFAWCDFFFILLLLASSLVCVVGCFWGDV